MPLFPRDKVKQGVDVIKDLIKEKFSSDKVKLKKWNKFMNFYFDKEWMTKVRPGTFCVFNCPDRTNNYLESYHRSMNQGLRTKPTTNNFICK